MPVRNTIRFDKDEAFYHVYNRGVNKQNIFRDAADKDYFLGLFERYLSPKPVKHPKGGVYRSYATELEILGFCLMDNHFHVLCYQVSQGALTEFIRALSTSYVSYFNKKYERRGPLFESRYKASAIHDPAYLEHISRYIHLNPADWRYYSYSSLPSYLGRRQFFWLKPGRILHIFSGDDYLRFVEEYESHKVELKQMKRELC